MYPMNTQNAAQVTLDKHTVDRQHSKYKYLHSRWSHAKSEGSHAIERDGQEGLKKTSRSQLSSSIHVAISTKF